MERVASQGPVAIVTADVSRAELFLVRIHQGIARPKRVTRTGPDRVDSGGPCNQLEGNLRGKGQHGAFCGPVSNRYLVRWHLPCLTSRYVLPCVLFSRSTTDGSYSFCGNTLCSIITLLLLLLYTVEHEKTRMTANGAHRPQE